ncbi:early nodulin-93-like [Capsicum annuum]|uniref:early nodulin-93-like n=1 Tax=Capsicum annuum TaxID=4072 RepID=UPI001FB0AB91|nr:early nodulin-93-like [Capsicum annuum]
MTRNVSLDSVDQKLALAKSCAHEGVVVGERAVVIASVATAIPTLSKIRMTPWKRTFLNPTVKALIVSTAAGMAYFVVADKTSQNSYAKLLRTSLIKAHN